MKTSIFGFAGSIIPALNPAEEKRMNGEDGEPAALTSEEQRAVLRIRDLDTGEEYIIGENEPAFDFDTFSRVQGRYTRADFE
jgi:hypothetical protein